MAYLRAYQMAAGDPGFKDFFKKAAKVVGGIAKKAAPFAGVAASFIPGGGLVSRAVGLGGKLLKSRKVLGAAAGLGGIAAGAIGRSAVSRFTDPFGQYGGTPGESLNGAALPGGFRIPGVGGGGTGRRYRRMKVTNVRALRRAIRRVNGFAKLARQSIRISRKVKPVRRKR